MCLETGVCFRPVPFTPSPYSLARAEAGMWGTQAEGEHKAAAESRCASLVCSGHLVTTPSPSAADYCLHLVLKPPNSPGPTEPPQGEPCGTLSLCSLGSRTWNRMGAQQRAGRSHQAGTGEAVHLTAPSGRSEAGSLCLSRLSVFLLSLCRRLSCYCTCRPGATGVRPPSFSPVV